MTVERESRLTRFVCDGDKCHKNYEGVDGFASAWQEAKAHGWVCFETSDYAWKHYCKDCKRDLGDD